MINNQSKEQIAVITKDQNISYGEFKIQINRFSELYKNKEVNRVAIFSENRLEWLYAFYATWQINRTIVTVDYMSSIDDVTYILNDCAPEIVFYSNEKKEAVEEIKKQCKTDIEFINFDEVQLSDSNDSHEWKIPEDKDDVAVIIYTSGTTGDPKGVMLTYQNIIINLEGVYEESKIYDHGKQTLILLPLHHIFPLVGTMVTPLYSSGTIVMAASMQSSDMMDALKNNHVNVMIGVPRLFELMYNGLKAKIDANKVASLLVKVASRVNSISFSRKVFKKVHDGFGGQMESFVTGGAALDPKIGNFFRALGFQVLEGFGMTEAAPMITFTRPGKVRIGSTGTVLLGSEIKIVDGEIYCKGPNVMKGYYNRPEETAAVIVDGWLRTGDIGRMDKNGFLYLTGRKKEIIVLSNGKNINPVVLEAKMERMSAFVSEVAVFFNKGNLHALIVPDYNQLTIKEVKDPHAYFRDTVMPEFNAKLTPYQRIMQFTLIKEEIPRTRLGKIQRFKLAELIEKPQENKKVKVKEPDTEEYKTVKSFIESQVNTTISPDDHIEFDIALDSLGKLGLIDFVENTFGVKISEDNLLKFPTIRKMVDFIRDNKLRHKVENINWSAILKEKVPLDLPKGSFMHNMINTFSKFYFRIYFRFKGQGHNNIPEGPCIIAPNHQSFFDGLLVSSIMKKSTIKRTYFYAKKKHVNNRFLRMMARKNNVIVMDLHKDLKESIQQLAEVLKRGKNVIIFPEGTRTQDGALGDFKQTFAILSKELNVPIVPVAINGAYKALPTGRFFPKIFTRINVDFLEPIYPAIEQTYQNIAEQVKKQIEDRIKK